MRLVIHDLPPEQWEAFRAEYADDRVVSDLGTIRPCVGCFCCWNKTPGRCVIRDGYEDMGALIHRADEVVVISRCTFGGFSGFVKNVFDRCLGYVLPQFELVAGETHHQKRYGEDKPFRFLFYGRELSEEEKACARRYVRAVCANIRGYVREVRFFDLGEPTPAPPLRSAPPSDRTVLLVGSMRSESGNSAKLARKLAALLPGACEILPLKRRLSDLEGLCAELADVGTLVLCTPLYVDGLPAQLIRLLEHAQHHPGPRRVYVLANMGLYESRQLVNLFSAVRLWCEQANVAYCGGLGVSAGELLGVLMEHLPFRLGPTRTLAKGMDNLADAIRRRAPLGEVYAEPCAFPRSLYIEIANRNWNRTARKNGLRPQDLYRRL